jgi:2-amino-4-hydroxy-6-hydroxymethyldihydropteridine diphosphokinase
LLHLAGENARPHQKASGKKTLFTLGSELGFDIMMAVTNFKCTERFHSVMIIVGLGANMTGRWGSPCQALLRALTELERRNIRVKARSRLYLTTPFGGVTQPTFVNAAALVETAMPAQALLSALKRIEIMAGRRPAKRWGPRTLDLDILDYKGVVRGWPEIVCKKQSRRRWITLPHAGIADRPFVLRPIIDIAPRWRHPATRISAAVLLRRAQRKRDGSVIEAFDEENAVLCSNYP